MKLKYYMMLLGVLLMAACDEKLEIDAPDFDVTTEAATYKAGQEITFNIKGGNAHMISFYSGETLKDYDSKEGRVVDISGSGIDLQFSSSVQLGAQANQLSVWASTNFSGDYSSVAKVNEATWTNITSRFKLGTSATLLASGKVDLSDLLVAGKPLYIGFKYNTKPQATNGIARQWFIQSFVLTSKATLDNGAAITIANQETAGFRIVDDNASNPAKALSFITNTRLTMQGNTYLHAGLPIFDPTNPIFDPENPQFDPKSPSYSPTLKLQTYVPFDPNSPYNDPASDHWAITKAITVDEVNLGPDWSTVLKGLSNPNLEVYRYTYATPGTYKAVFVAANNSIDDTKKVVKEITLTITP